MSLTQEQLELRRGRVMASEVAAITGFNPHVTPFQAWALNLGHETFDGNAATQCGDFLEEGCLKMACTRLGQSGFTQPGTLLHTTHSWAGATPDGILPNGEGIQIKVHGLHAARDFKGQPGEDKNDPEWDNNIVPQWHLIQCQWEMWVYASHAKEPVETWWLGCLINSTDFRLYHLRRDRDMQDGLRDRAHAFWKRHLDPKGKQEPPPLDGSDFAGEYLRRKFPRNNGTLLPFNPDLIPWAQRYSEAHQKLKEWEFAKKESQNALIQAVAESDGVEGICTFKSPKGTPKCDWEALAKEIGATPAQIQKFTTTPEPSRRFNLTWKDQQ